MPPGLSQSAGSQVRSGGAGKASYSGGELSLNAGASHSPGCKRRLASMAEHQVDDKVPWNEIFGAVEDDNTAVKRVGVVGLHDSLASELVDCFASKPSVANVGVHLGPDGTCSKFDIMPGVTALPTQRDVCAWSDIIFLCGSYEDADTFLLTPNVQQAVNGKCLLQLASGTPEEALTTSQLAKTAGARYLDAFVFSEGTANVFNNRLSAMMVSGDKEAWREVEGVVRAAAPASFYGGRRVEWANTIGVGVVTFLASVHMGLSQAQSITTKFALPPHVLPCVLDSGYMHVVKSLVKSAAAKPSPDSRLPFTSADSLHTSSGVPEGPAGSADASTFSDDHVVNGDMVRGGSSSSSALPSSMHAVHVTAPTARPPGAAASGGAATATAPVGSAAWVSQLERIREVCQKANVSSSLIDGFIVASGATSHSQKTQPTKAYTPLPTILAASARGTSADCDEFTEGEEGLGEVFGQGGVSETLDFDVRQVLLDADMVGDDAFLADWAP